MDLQMHHWKEYEYWNQSRQSSKWSSKSLEWLQMPFSLIQTETEVIVFGPKPLMGLLDHSITLVSL